AGQVVHPTHGHYTNTLANGVVAYWQSKGERFRFRPIHRLDEETSGLVVIAKNGYIHQQLSDQLQQGKVDKRYVAFVYGAPQPPQGIIEAPIARDPEQPHLRTVLAEGAYAKTEYWCERTFAKSSQQSAGASLVRLKLYTG